MVIHVAGDMDELPQVLRRLGPWTGRQHGAILALKPAHARNDHKRLLIVDDNATNRPILALQAGKWGMVSRETEFTEEALRCLMRCLGEQLGPHPRRQPDAEGTQQAAHLVAQ